jgi:hypothetical protein
MHLWKLLLCYYTQRQTCECSCSTATVHCKDEESAFRYAFLTQKPVLDAASTVSHSWTLRHIMQLCTIVLTPFPPWYHPMIPASSGPYCIYRRPLWPPRAGPKRPWAGYGFYLEVTRSHRLFGRTSSEWSPCHPHVL